MMEDKPNSQKEGAAAVPDADEEYQVGYGKPPKATRFKPGQSGNPKGRKKKAESVSDQVGRILGKRISVTEGGTVKRLTLQEVMLTTLANKAAKGDLKALAFVLDLAKSHEGESGSTISPELLEADSNEIIAAFLRQQTFGQRIGTAESETTDAAIRSEFIGEDANDNSLYQQSDDLTAYPIEEQEKHE